MMLRRGLAALLLWSLTLVDGFHVGPHRSSSSSHGVRPVGSRVRPRPVSIQTVEDYDGQKIEEVAGFFVDNFLLPQAPGPVTVDQRAAFIKDVQGDMETRYGELMGKRKLPSALLVAKNDAGEIVGCCGVEIALAQRAVKYIIPKAEGEVG